MDTGTIFLICASLSVLLFSVALFHTFQEINREDDKPFLDLAVCILSARNNTELRNSIRQSWLKEVDDSTIFHEQHKSVLAKFIIGSQACDIHPDNRVSPYACERWDFSVPADPSSELLMFQAEDLELQGKRNAVYSLSIKTMHAILLKRVGIIELFPFGSMPKSAQVILYDAVSEEEISQTRFSHASKGNLVDGYYYKPIEELYLPKNYEFTMHLELATEEQHAQNSDFLEGLVGNLTSTSFAYVEGHRGMLVVKFLHGVRHVVDAKKNPHAVPFLSLIFTIQDQQGLRAAFDSANQKDLMWREKVKQESSVLATESNTHGDVLLVDMTDTYRNLPRKLLLCHRWYFENYRARALLKTDDDCFVDLTSILAHLTEKSRETVATRDEEREKEEKDAKWWGNFRRNWLVERHGKWKDERFTAPVYPDFACGSGNVVSRPVHVALAQNWESLNLFQGEDVSMGIWLSAFDVRQEHDTRWRCSRSCTDDMIALPQLDPRSLVRHWNNSQRCPSPCHSCDGHS